jgi:hypothetical protein
VNASDPTGQFLKTNWKFFWEWVFEDGLQERWYGEGTVELAEFKTSPGAVKMRREYKAAACPQQGKGYFGKLEAYFKTASMPHTTGFQVGGFVYTAINNNNGTVTYHLKNVAGAYSFFLHFPLIPKRQARETGRVHLFGDITQVFQWIEPIPCCQRR